MKDAHIVELAESYLDQYKLRKAPIDVLRIAEGLGVDVKVGVLGENVSGVIYREGSRTVIGINSSQSPVRQRFTLAHELGHNLLHKEQDLWVDSQAMFRKDDQAGDPREMQANRFAAELLMPRRLLEGIKIPSDPRRVESFIRELAREFDVSFPAMSYRLINLQLLEIY